MSQEPLRIVQVVSGLALADGGPSQSVPRLSEAISQVGLDVRLYTDFQPGKAVNANFTGTTFFQRNFSGWPILGKLHVSTGMAKALQDIGDRIDLVHGHGLWRMPNLYSGNAAGRRGVPIVVSPRGMLSPVALKGSAYSKALFLLVGQRDTLSATTCFHATSEFEYEDIRRFGITAPVIIVPNGVDLPLPSGGSGRAPSSGPSDLKTLLFLGRIHPIKGIDHLVRAWSRVAEGFPDWRLRIVGPGEPGHTKMIADLIERMNVPRVTMEAGLAGQAKHAALAAADLFVQPSLSENFGMTIAESLACGRPVIVTKGAPWAGVVENACGWWIETGEEALEAALRLGMSTPRQELDQMGLRGQVWVEQAYSWSRSANDMVALYLWLCGRGPRPNSVLMS